MRGKPLIALQKPGAGHVGRLPHGIARLASQARCRANSRDRASEGGPVLRQCRYRRRRLRIMAGTAFLKGMLISARFDLSQHFGRKWRKSLPLHFVKRRSAHVIQAFPLRDGAGIKRRGVPSSVRICKPAFVNDIVDNRFHQKIGSRAAGTTNCYFFSHFTRPAYDT